MSIPATLPVVVLVALAVMDRKIVVRVPPDDQRGLENRWRVVAVSEPAPKFEVISRVGENNPLELVRRIDAPVGNLLSRALGAGLDVGAFNFCGFVGVHGCWDATARSGVPAPGHFS